MQLTVNLYRFFFIGVFLCLLSATGMAQQPRVSEFKGSSLPSDESVIQLQWVVESESQVILYELHRKLLRDSDFKKITEVSVGQGVSAGRYEYSDNTVFKTTASSEPVVYNLYAKMQNGDLLFLAQAEVNFTTTAVRRTWGSIKAMFQ